MKHEMQYNEKEFLISDLQQLYSLYMDKVKIEDNPLMTESEYVNEKINAITPVKPICPICPEKNKYFEETSVQKPRTFEYIFLSIIPAFGLLVSVFVFAEKPFICLICLALLVLYIKFWLITFFELAVERKKRYKNDVLLLKKNEEYMKNEYPELLREYEIELDAYNHSMESYNSSNEEFLKNLNKTLVAYSAEWEKLYNEQEENLKEIKSKIENYRDLIPQKWYSDIPSIVEILEDGRADSLKEAINVYVEDMQSEALIKAERERMFQEKEWRDREKLNRIREEEEENRKREENARFEAKSAEEKARYEAKSAGQTQCSHCKRSHCSQRFYNRGNCAAFIPR